MGRDCSVRHRSPQLAPLVVRTRGATPATEPGASGGAQKPNLDPTSARAACADAAATASTFSQALGAGREAHGARGMLSADNRSCNETVVARHARASHDLFRVKALSSESERRCELQRSYRATSARKRYLLRTNPGYKAVPNFTERRGRFDASREVESGWKGMGAAAFWLLPLGFSLAQALSGTVAIAPAERLNHNQLMCPAASADASTPVRRESPAPRFSTGRCRPTCARGLTAPRQRWAAAMSCWIVDESLPPCWSK